MKVLKKIVLSFILTASACNSDTVTPESYQGNVAGRPTNFGGFGGKVSTGGAGGKVFPHAGSGGALPTAGSGGFGGQPIIGGSGGAGGDPLAEAGSGGSVPAGGSGGNSTAGAGGVGGSVPVGGTGGSPVAGSGGAPSVNYVIVSNTYISEFSGWRNGTLFHLADGTWWRQTSFELTVAVSVQPQVIVALVENSYYLMLIGSESAVVEPVQAVIESRISGTFNGWDGSTTFNLTNGQVWQQAVYAYKYHYAYSPSCMIYLEGGAYYLWVDGMDGDVVRVNRVL